MKKLLQLMLTCLAFIQVQNLSATTCGAASAGVLGSNALVCSGTNDISSVAGCGNISYQGGQEALITFTPAISGTMTLDYVGSSWSGIFVWDACPTTGVCVGTPVTGSGTSKTMILPVTSGVTYFIMVDTWPTPNSPCPGTLNIAVAAPPTCFETSNYSTANLTSTSVDLLWTTGGATDWVVEYGLTGFTQGSGTVVSVSVNDSLNVTGLTGLTSYDWYVRDYCGVGDSSLWSVVNTFYTGTCIPAPSSVDYNGITNVTMGTINNTTVGEVGNYANYTTMITDAAQSTVFNIDVTIEYGYGLWAWVNWNDDLDFDDVGEFFFLGESPAVFGAPGGTLSSSILIPLTASLGNHTIRIGGSDTQHGVGSLHDPCYTGTYGTFEDYTLNIIAAPACAQPVINSVSNVTATSADLFWTTGGASNWDVEWGVLGFVQGAGTMITNTATNPYSLAGLTSGTTYEFYVRDNCGGIESTWAGPFGFVTNCPASFVAPYMENFDGAVSNSNTPPVCWTNTLGGEPWIFRPSTGGTGSSPGYGVSGSVDHTSGSGTFAWIDASGNIGVNELISPMIDLSALTTPYAGFWFLSNNNSDGAQNTLEFSAWDGAAWVLVSTFSGNNANWTEVATTLPASIPSLTQFRLVQVTSVTGTGSAYNNDLLVDDFFVVEAPTCFATTVHTVSNLTAYGADISWTTGGAADWILEYGPTGFTQGTGTIVDPVTNPFSITSLTPETGYEWYVRDSCGLGDLGVWSNANSFTTSVTCPAPTGLSANLVSYSEANLDWTTGSSSDWFVEYGPTGFTQGTGTIVSVTGTESLNVTGLMEQTTYQWYVLDYCGVADTSLWTGPNTFETPCAPITPDYSEDFASFVPGCWEEYTNGNSAAGPNGSGSGSWGSDGFANNGFSGAAKINIYGSAVINDWLVSPEFDLSSGGYQLVFDVAGTAYASSVNPAAMGSDDTLSLMKSVDGGLTWTFEMIWGQGNEPSLAGDRASLYLGTGASTMFAFYGANGATSGGDNDLFVDNFTICTPVVNTTPIMMDLCDGDMFTLNTGAIITTAGMFNDTLVAVSSCDSIITYDVTLFMTSASAQDMVICQGSTLALPGGTMVTMAGSYDEVFTNAVGCDSTATFSVTVNVATASSQDVHLCDGATYTLPLSGLVVSAANAYVETVTNSLGCDSLITYNVTTGMSSATAVALSFCTGGDVTLADGTVVTMAGTYMVTETNTSGCDEVITYTVTENMTSMSTMMETICSGDSYMFDGTALTMAGTYTQTEMNAAGCDSLITLTLTVNATSATPMTETICSGDSYMFDGTALTMAGTYTQTEMNAAGCDSVITLMLTVNAPSATMMDATICDGDSMMFDGAFINTAGTYTQTEINAAGCDSVLTLTLTVNTAADEVMDAEICKGSEYTFGTQTLTEAGVYTETFTNVSGCDYEMVLTLVVNNNISISEDVLLCGDMLSYTLANGTVVTEAGIYTALVPADNGCNSIITYNISTCVGIFDVDNNIAMTVYPNPANEVLNIVFAEQLTAVNNITVVNVLGQDVYSTNNVDVTTVLINTSSLTSGIYYLQVTSDNKVSVKSFTVAN